MNLRKTEASFEIFLSVMGIIAFAYLAGQIFSEVEIVSAQTPGGISQDGSTQNDGNQISPELQQQLQNAGYNSVQDWNQGVDNSLQSGTVSPIQVAILQWLENQIPRISGGLPSGVQQIFQKGVYVCPLDKKNGVCQNFLADKCQENCQVPCIEKDISKEPLPSTEDCALGTCYNANEGICQGFGDYGGGTPKKLCTLEMGGKWFAKGDNELGNLCQYGCCLIGENALFGTKGQCEKAIRDVGGSFDSEDFEWKPEITEELSCLGSAKKKQRGACTTPVTGNPNGENDCKFVTANECSELHGNFNLDTLCTSPDLKTICEIQDKSSCFDREDEVYFIDSCGNKANIYDASKKSDVSYWSNVVKKEDSCAIGTINKPTEFQSTCGNCNRLFSSFCGEKTERTDSTQKQEIPGQDFVCRDMGCYEKDFLGNLNRVREHGESWCAYDSSIGLPGNDNSNPLGAISFLPKNPLDNLLGAGGNFGGLGGLSGFGDDIHSTDTPGSQHFRRTCQNGEMKTELCDEFRNRVCIEQQTPKGVDASLLDPALLQSDPQRYFKNIGSAAENFDLFAGTFSSASCRTNRWAECFGYNPDLFESRIIGLAGNKAGQILEMKLQATCGQDPDCFVKTVDLTSGSDDTFKFSYCAPRYPPGFDFVDTKESGENYCKQASAACTAVFVKEAKAGGFGGIKWECKANCDCVDGDDPDSAKPSQEFINQMNSLCVSLGDCGNHVNYLGTPGGGKGYKVCTGKDGECKGLGGLGGIGGIGDVLGGIGGTGNYANDANAVQGEYIQSGGNFLQDVLGKSFGKFFEDASQNLGLDGLIQQFEGALGAGAGVPDLSFPGERAAKSGLKVAGISGAAGAAGGALLWGGVGATIVGYHVTSAALPAITYTTLASANAAAGELGGTMTPIMASSPTLAGFTGAAIGFAVGVAIASFMIDVLGIGAGLDPVTTYAVIGVAGVSGAAMGVGIALAGKIGGACAGGFVIACIVFVALIFYLALLKVFGVGEVKEVDVIFECQKWVPPTGGNCEICGEDKLSDGSNKFPCSKSACESIGQGCRFVKGSETEDGGLCIVSEELDSFPPKMISVKEDVEDFISEKFEYKNFEFNKKFDVRKKGDNECLDSYERINFGFNLDEHGRCRMSAKLPDVSADASQTFEQMSALGQGLSKEQIISFSSLDLDNLGLEDELNVEQKNDITLYVICEDYYEHKSLPFEIGLCVVPQDRTAVQYLDLGPLQQFASFNSENYDLGLNINEPAECRWDNRDIPFREMPASHQCAAVSSGNKFTCNLNDIPIQSGKNEICIKCLDHPEWQGTPRESERNVNSQCFTAGVERSSGALEVGLISPESGAIIKRGSSPTTVEIEVLTSGGAFNGDASCSYEYDNSGKSLFSSTGGKTHKQLLTQVTAGRHHIKIECADRVNPNAVLELDFEVFIDNVMPKITRIYRDGKSLFIVTDEKAQCGFTLAPIERRNGACDFRVDEFGSSNGIELMNVVSGSQGFRHSASFQDGKTYYIKCEDEFHNQPLGCGIIATGEVIQ